MRIYVFGAGASIHAGYPLGSNLWVSLEAWAKDSILPGDYCHGAVEQMRSTFDVEKPFELVLTDLDNRVANPKDRFERALLATLRGQMQYAICRFFDSIRLKDADLYRSFARDVLRIDDVVITFNYDVSLDRELSMSGKWNVIHGYGFTIDSSAQRTPSCTLLKLHGSTNWIAEIFEGLRGQGFISLNQPSLGRRPVIPTPEFAYLGTAKNDPRFRVGTGFIPSLIMPTANKKFYMETSFGREWEEFWDWLWLQASDAVSEADEIHMIGYSLPQYDDRARKLLLETAKKTLMCPSVAAAQRRTLYAPFKMLASEIHTRQRMAHSRLGWMFRALSRAPPHGAHELETIVCGD
jgi:hypothetical protein